MHPAEDHKQQNPNMMWAYLYSRAGKEPDMFDVMIVNDNLEDTYGHLKDALLEVSLK